jgi:AcrR family transcriptional regulator
VNVTIVNIDFETGLFFMASRTKAKSNRSYHHGDLHQALIGEALKLIEQRKHVEFTVREIASRTGVTHTAAYRHFADKRALLAAIAEEGFRLLTQAFGAVLQEARVRDRAVQLHDLGMAYVRFALGHPGHFRAMFHSDLAKRESFPALELAAKEAFIAVRLTIENGIKEKVFRGSSAEAPALAAWSLVHGFALLVLEKHIGGHGDSSAASLDSLASSVIELLEEGLLKR